MNAWFRNLLNKWREGITNQGILVSEFKHTMTRQRQRREGFRRRDQELVKEFGYNLPRTVRRRIAWGSWRGYTPPAERLRESA